MTRRRHIGERERVAIFQAANGVCHLCNGKIQAGQAWEVSHDIPLELGGADDASNMLPAHKKCHRHHTATVDIPAIAKAKRREARHIGAKPPSRNPLPGSKTSRWKRKMNGSIVERNAE